MSLKKIPLYNLYKYGNHHILPNCKLLAFHAPTKKRDNYLEIKISHFDIKESIAYQKIFDMFTEAREETLKELKLRVPKELIRHIMGYAFTANTRQLFFATYQKEIGDKVIENSESGPHCSIL
ncbi:MAG TPA: hypothetical protein PK657_09155 [Legionella sp.]|nr:hypothetical protein [Legionella sp.]